MDGLDKAFEHLTDEEDEDDRHYKERLITDLVDFLQAAAHEAKSKLRFNPGVSRIRRFIAENTEGKAEKFYILNRLRKETIEDKSIFPRSIINKVAERVGVIGEIRRETTLPY